MTAPASAYAALGLEPGADREAIERAYRDLIKRYHPDRSGGDAARAAEINRAYFELRRQPDPGPAKVIRPPRAAMRPARRRRARRRWWPLLLVLLAAAAILQRDWIAAEWSRLADLQTERPTGGRASAVALDSAAIDGPLDEKAIARSIEQAVALVERRDEQELADRSRDCHRRMRSRPSLEQLDRCAAFENAVAASADANPLDDSGVFTASAITARQMTAGSLLSRDYLAIERRLDRIRTVVQLTLRPAPPPPRAVPIELEPEPVAP